MESKIEYRDKTAQEISLKARSNTETRQHRKSACPEKFFTDASGLSEI